LKITVVALQLLAQNALLGVSHAQRAKSFGLPLN
jgi:hypothetical protein